MELQKSTHIHAPRLAPPLLQPDAMVIEIMLCARDDDDVATTVSATVPLEHYADAGADGFVETVVRYARGAAQHLRDETASVALLEDHARDFIPLASFVATHSSR